MIMNILQLDFDQLRSMEYEWLLFDAIFASGYVDMRKSWIIVTMNTF